MPTSIDPQWWEIADPEERAHQALTIAELLARNSDAISTEADAIRVYEGERETEHEQSGSSGVGVTNTVQSVVDAFVSDIVRTRIRVQFLTQKGCWEDRQQAMGMSRACEAIDEDAGLYGTVGIDVCRDGCVSPMGGALKYTPDYANSRVKIERISAARLYTDQRDSRMGRPRTLVYADDFAPEVLIAQFPDHADALAELAEQTGKDVQYLDLEDEIGTVVSISRRIQVYEIWHLPSNSPDSSSNEAWSENPGHDGRHCIVCGELRPGGTIALHDAPWPLEFFPIAIFRPYRRMRGWSGHSLVERLKSTQRQLDQWQARVDGMMNLHSRTMLYVNREAKVNTQGASNDWSRVIEGNGPAETAIRVLSANSVPPELFKRIDDIIQWTRDFSGKTELTMMGKRPVGVQSGVALRQLTESESVRHTDVFRAWEEFRLQGARITVELCRLLAAKDPGFSVFWGDDKELVELKWAKINLKNSRFRLRLWPTNLLPQTPGAKMEKLVELYQAQGISQQQFQIALSSEFPDIQALASDTTALLNNVERKLALVIEAEAVTDESLPHGFMALDLAKQVGLSRVNELEAGGAPSSVIAAVNEWLSLVDEEIAKQPSAAPVPPIAPAPVPPETQVYA